MKHRLGALLATLSVCCIGIQSCKLFGTNGDEPIGVEVRTPNLKGYLAFPSRYDSTRSYPLLIGLHGNGGYPEEFANAFSTFWEESLVVAVAQGEYPRSGGYSWFYITADRSLWEAYDTRSVNTLVELVDSIRARYRIGKVFVMGFSQGATLAYMVGFKRPELVTGVLAVGGYLPEIDQEGSIVHAADIAAARGVKMFVARGTSDPVVSHQTYVTQRDFLTSNGYDVTSREYPGAHQITDDLQLEMRVWIRPLAR